MGGSNDPLHRGGPAVNSVNNNQLNKSMKQKEGFSNPDPYLGSLNNAADQDYNYNINLDFAGSGENMIDNSGIIASSDVKASSGIIGGTGGVVGKNVANPLLASV